MPVFRVCEIYLPTLPSLNTGLVIDSVGSLSSILGVIVGSNFGLDNFFFNFDCF